MTAFVTC